MLTIPYTETSCTVTSPTGKEFTANGAAVTQQHAIAYPEFVSEFVGAKGVLKDWHGAVIGTCRITSRWRTPYSFVSSYMCQIEGDINGRKYTGRGSGSGMIWQGRAKAVQS